jgi:hypothetical protein
MKSRSFSSYSPFLLFIIGFILIPVWQLKWLYLMPGDIGDARLNNYFLENIYQFVLGKSDSLWNLSFFWPFPYVLGFSDNLFGASPVYILARLFSAETDTSFQIWFYFGYVVNYFAAYYSLRKLGFGGVASSIGALIFTFSLPTTVHAGHAQLHYRFGVPLAAVFMFEFFERKDVRSILISGAWCVWQFYCSIYMGFFTLLMLSAMIFSWVVGWRIYRPSALISIGKNWLKMDGRSRLNAAFGFFLLLCLMALLFYPYVQAKLTYDFTRSWGEISSTLPRPQSYILSDRSMLWKPSDKNSLFDGIPMRWEHQMFVGVVPLLLAVFGVVFGRGKKILIFSATLILLVFSTMFLKGFSFWYLVHNLPLISAIRVLTRLDQVFLFPLAVLSAAAVDFALKNNQRRGRVWQVVAILFFLLEASATNMYTSVKEDWRQRLHVVERILPVGISKESVLFFAQRKGPYYADELDNMWVSLNHGVKTMNGYSGNTPPGSDYSYQRNCIELSSRVQGYLGISGNVGGESQYLKLVEQVIPVGFLDCGSTRSYVPDNSIGRPYSVEEFQKISYEIEGVREVEGLRLLDLVIYNSSNVDFQRRPSEASPVRISWRYSNEGGDFVSGWDLRMNLPGNIAKNGRLNVSIPLEGEAADHAKFVQISLVQEGVFWAHDVGIPPAEFRLIGGEISR